MSFERKGEHKGDPGDAKLGASHETDEIENIFIEIVTSCQSEIDAAVALNFFAINNPLKLDPHAITAVIAKFGEHYDQSDTFKRCWQFLREDDTRSKTRKGIVEGLNGLLEEKNINAVIQALTNALQSSTPIKKNKLAYFLKPFLPFLPGYKQHKAFFEKENLIDQWNAKFPAAPVVPTDRKKPESKSEIDEVTKLLSGMQFNLPAVIRPVTIDVDEYGYDDDIDFKVITQKKTKVREIFDAADSMSKTSLSNAIIFLTEEAKNADKKLDPYSLAAIHIRIFDEKNKMGEDDREMCGFDDGLLNLKRAIDQIELEKKSHAVPLFWEIGPRFKCVQFAVKTDNYGPAIEEMKNIIFFLQNDQNGVKYIAKYKEHLDTILKKNQNHEEQQKKRKLLLPDHRAVKRQRIELTASSSPDESPMNSVCKKPYFAELIVDCLNHLPNQTARQSFYNALLSENNLSIKPQDDETIATHFAILTSNEAQPTAGSVSQMGLLGSGSGALQESKDIVLRSFTPRVNLYFAIAEGCCRIKKIDVSDMARMIGSALTFCNNNRERNELLELFIKRVNLPPTVVNSLRESTEALCEIAVALKNA